MQSCQHKLQSKHVLRGPVPFEVCILLWFINWSITVSFFHVFDIVTKALIKYLKKVLFVFVLLVFCSTEKANHFCLKHRECNRIENASEAEKHCPQKK